MWKNRLACILFTAVLAVLLFFYYKPFFAGVIGIWILVILLMEICIFRDIKLINVKIHVRSGGRKGQNLTVIFDVTNKRPLLAANSVMIDMNIHNSMFDTEENYQLKCILSHDKNQFKMDIPAEQCGKLTFSCTGIFVSDLLNLIKRRIKVFEPAYTVVYPKPVSLELEMSENTEGHTVDGRIIQNKKGSDSSEMYDIREYVPGDDVRAIHWKLSSKTDELILRQASNPAHYDVAVLPDFGLDRLKTEVSLEEMGMAVDICAQIAEKFILNHTFFCMLIPTRLGLESVEVRSVSDLERMKTQWMSFKIQENSGDGLKYFQMDHLEQKFPRLIIVSAGRYQALFKGLEYQMGISLVNIVKDIQKQQTQISGHCEITELPLTQEENETYRIVY